MKLFLAVTLAALTTATFAFGDYVPGRIRPLALAQMQVVEASGEFAGLKDAMLYQNFQDGGDFVSLKLAIKGGQPFTLPISAVRKGSCGSIAWSESVAFGDRVIRSQFSDFSEAICTVFKETTWELKLEMKDAAGRSSTATFRGNPEPLFVTL